MRFLRYKDLKPHGVPWSRQHLGRLIRAKKFPAPVKIGANSIAWVEGEVFEYLEEKIAERDAADECRNIS